ncbi:hypothetical protein DW876_00370 [Hungatella hathewayi]|nr:hypothetical protein DW876_00370 [Hungatella hathewayi]
MIPRGVFCWRTNAWDKYSFKCIKNNFRNSIRKYIGNDIRNSIRKCSETLSGDVSERILRNHIRKSIRNHITIYIN